MKTLNKIPALPKSHMITWYVCRALLFVWGVWGLMHGYTSELVQACFAIAFTHLWDLFQLLGGQSFITRFPYRIQTMLNVYICFACVVGTTLNSRTSFTGIDIPEHIFAGFMASSGGYELCAIMQGKKNKIKISVQAVFALSFAVTILVGWEFYEFTMDRLYGFVMQHGHEAYAEGLTDTMVDLILGSFGALVAMLYEAFKTVGYIGKNRKHVRAQYRAQREEYKAYKQQMIAQGRKDEL